MQGRKIGSVTTDMLDESGFPVELLSRKEFFEFLEVKISASGFSKDEVLTRLTEYPDVVSIAPKIGLQPALTPEYDRLLERLSTLQIAFSKFSFVFLRCFVLLKTLNESYHVLCK